MGKAFHTAHRWDLEWQDDVDVLSLRGGVQVKVFYEDPDLGVADMLIKFPPGYVEPEHAHQSSHSIVVLEGVQIVRGVALHPGDYVWASGPSRTARTSTRRAAWSSPRSAACRPGTATRGPPPGRSSHAGHRGTTPTGWRPSGRGGRAKVCASRAGAAPSAHNRPTEPPAAMSGSAPCGSAPRRPSRPNSRAAFAAPICAATPRRTPRPAQRPRSCMAMSKGRSVPSSTWSIPTRWARYRNAATSWVIVSKYSWPKACRTSAALTGISGRTPQAWASRPAWYGR